MIKKPLKPLDDVIRGARHCISGEVCRGRPGIKACPYYDKSTDACSGDYRRDLLRWIQKLRDGTGGKDD